MFDFIFVMDDLIGWLFILMIDFFWFVIVGLLLNCEFVCWLFELNLEIEFDGELIVFGFCGFWELNIVLVKDGVFCFVFVIFWEFEVEFVLDWSIWRFGMKLFEIGGDVGVVGGIKLFGIVFEGFLVFVIFCLWFKLLFGIICFFFIGIFLIGFFCFLFWCLIIGLFENICCLRFDNELFGLLLV